MGMGYGTRKTCESLWLAICGDGLKRVDKGVRQGFVADEGRHDDGSTGLIVARRRENSRKPDEIYVALERLFGDVRRIELFGRRERPGWTHWGNELLPPDAQSSLPFAPDELVDELR
jgi:N6-adenosine-specific RNA methylase IME4